MKSEHGPHAKRLGWLKNGNPPGDPHASPRCGAHSRRTGAPCQGPAMKNGRCRMHGGRSTGPQTNEGLERSQSARLIHGKYSASAKARKKELVLTIRTIRKWIDQI